MESIKCHHNDFADYIQDNYIQELNAGPSLNKTIIEYYNFYFINDTLINKSTIYYFIKYDYYTLIDIILQSNVIKINDKLINKLFFSTKFLIKLFSCNFI